MLLYNLKLLSCITIIGLLIKILDDYYDDEESSIDIEIIKNRSKNIILYGLVMFSIACTINHSLTITFFLSAYIIGMFKDFNRKLTMGLKGYQESILLIVFSLIFFNYTEILSSFLIILIVDLVDDILDIKKDKKFNRKNYVLRFGLGEVLITVIIFVLLTLKLDIIKLIYSMLVFFTIQILENGGIKKWI